MTAYLLPCSCGQKTRVEPRQAGEVIACSCGASLTVPTMLEMATLQQAEPLTDASEKQSSWGVRQRLFLLGTLIALAAGAPAIYLLSTPPDPPRRIMSHREIRRQAQTLRPVHAWQLYHNLRMEGPQRQPMPQEEAYAKKLLQQRIYAGALLLVACVGIGLIVVGVTQTKPRGESQPDDGSDEP